MKPFALSHLKAHQVMGKVMKRGDPERLATILRGTSAATIRSWARPPETKDDEGTGRGGPLARIERIIAFVVAQDGSPTRAHPLAAHIAHLAGGVFVPIEAFNGGIGSEAVAHLNRSLAEAVEFAETLRVACFEHSPGVICPKTEMPQIQDEADDAVAAILGAVLWAREQSENGGRDR